MKKLRENPKESYGGLKVLEIKDFAGGTDGLPPSNVLRFRLEENSWFCVRPSGTEPKVKFYFGAKGASREEAQQRLERVRTDVLA